MNSREIYNSNGDFSISNKTLYDENLEEIIYSEGMGFKAEIYLGDTGESDGVSFEDESSLTSGWV